MDYSTDRFLAALYARSQQDINLLTVDDDQLPALFETKRARLRAVVGLDALDALDFAPSVHITSESAQDGFTRHEGYVNTLPELTTPLYVLTPPQYEKTVIYCHGHGLGAEEAVFESHADKYQKCLPITLARAGYRVFVPELTGFNRVVQSGYREDDYRGCYAISTQLLMHGLTMTAVRVNQILQLIDHINRENVKPILAGISGGGLVASFTAALGPDIAGAFISGYANTFKGCIMSMFHCVDNYIPNILSVGEEPEIIALACPTPLLFSAGDQDSIFPVAHTREAIETIRDIYARRNAGDHIAAEIFQGNHEMSTAVLMDWLRQIQ